jgi:AICAR transformylase/IMP cyclohydrolase PurH
MGYYNEKQIHRDDDRKEAERLKQEGITILATLNTAVAILQHGLNIDDVCKVSQQLLDYRDKELYGEQNDK